MKECLSGLFALHPFTLPHGGGRNYLKEGDSQWLRLMCLGCRFLLSLQWAVLRTRLPAVCHSGLHSKIESPSPLPVKELKF